MELRIVRRSRKLHSLLWFMASEEYSRLDCCGGSLVVNSDGVDVVNRFLTSKNPFDVLCAANTFGRPLAHRELALDPSFTYGADGVKRVFDSAEFVERLRRGDYSAVNKRMLASESWLYSPNWSDQLEKESSARRCDAKFGADEDALRRIADSYGDNLVVVEEPYLDWIWLRNALDLANTLRCYLADPDRYRDKVLTNAGFKRCTVTEFGAFAREDDVFDAFVVPIAFNEYWRARKYLDLAAEAIKLLPIFESEGYLRWAPYSRLGFVANGNGYSRVVKLKTKGSGPDGAEIRYIVKNQIDGTPGTIASFKKDWGGNLYLAIKGEFADEAQAADYFLRELVSAYLFSGDIELNLSPVGCSGQFVARSLSSQLWLSMFANDGTALGTCKNCGLPFYTRGAAPNKYCSNACTQAAYRARG